MNFRRSGCVSGVLLGGAVIVVIATVVSASPAIAAGAYPSKPIRIVVPFTPGGANDLLGRIVAQGLTDRLKQNAVVDNRPGAGTVIGTEIVAKAAPDGARVTASLSNSWKGFVDSGQRVSRGSSETRSRSLIPSVAW